MAVRSPPVLSAVAIRPRRAVTVWSALERHCDPAVASRYGRHQRSVVGLIGRAIDADVAGRPRSAALPVLAVLFRIAVFIVSWTFVAIAYRPSPRRSISSRFLPVIIPKEPEKPRSNRSFRSAKSRLIWGAHLPGLRRWSGNLQSRRTTDHRCRLPFRLAEWDRLSVCSTP